MNLIERLRWLNNDELLATFVPPACYWILATIFHLISLTRIPFFEKYKIQPIGYTEKNKVTLRRVVIQVLLQHSIQSIVTVILFIANQLLQLQDFDAPLSITRSVPRFILAAFFFDTWQYWIHRWMHINKWLYINVHSIHHQLLVPYAYGALYNHPLEAFMLDTCGGAITSIVAGFTPIETAIFISVAMIKTVDDHSGYDFPWDPIPRIFQNNSKYHDIHHQIKGIKYNFSQPFFCIWDRMMGTEWTKGSIYEKNLQATNFNNTTNEGAPKWLDKQS